MTMRKFYKQPTSTLHLGNPYIELQQATYEKMTHVKIRMETKTLEDGNKRYAEHSFKRSIRKRKVVEIVKVNLYQASDFSPLCPSLTYM